MRLDFKKNDTVVLGIQQLEGTSYTMAHFSSISLISETLIQMMSKKKHYKNIAGEQLNFLSKIYNEIHSIQNLQFIFNEIDALFIN